MFEVVEAAFSMKMDLYRQSEFQDPDTGAIKKQWNFYQTVDCSAKGIISNSSINRTGDRQQIGNKYANVQVIEVKTSNKISMRDKATNIRNKNNIPIWTELNFPTETPTVFEVVGSSPITDPFGELVGWNTTFKRSENQQIGL